MARALLNVAHMTQRLYVPLSESDHALGLRSAPITLVEYGDFDCRFCAAAYPVVRELRLRYRSSLCFVFRHNPRGGLHSRSKLAAHGAEAAAAQGEFWRMHDMLFERGAPAGEEELCAYAELLSLNLTRFAQDLHGPAVTERVLADELGGLRSGIVGTPAFFINGQPFGDKPDLDTLSQAISTALLLNTAAHST